jgi:hypothetical protein
MQADQKLQRRRRTESESEVNQAPLIGRSFEWLEFYFFFLVGGALWVFVAYKSLQFLRFPFHAHPYETVLIFLGPILLLGIILKLIDRGTRLKSE